MKIGDLVVVNTNKIIKPTIYEILKEVNNNQFKIKPLYSNNVYLFNKCVLRKLTKTELHETKLKISGNTEKTPEIDMFKTKIWKENGFLHCLDGPAVEFGNGSKEWFVNGKHHRLDGPAIEYPNGDKYWYINGEHLTEREFNDKTRNT